MKRDEFVCFDIETTGLSADDRVVSYCLMSRDDTTSMCCDCQETEMMEQLAVDVETATSGKKLVTFNGENWSGGFDIPFLRTRYVINDMIDTWPFGGVKHIDLMPIFQKKFNTSIVEKPTVESLSAAQCKGLLKVLGYSPAATKADNVKLLDAVTNVGHRYEIGAYVLEHGDEKVSNKYGLKHCYHLLFGGEEGMTGEEVPMLWLQHEYKKIAEYNAEDCRMTRRLLGVCLATVPEYDMRYFVL